MIVQRSDSDVKISEELDNFVVDPNQQSFITAEEYDLDVK